MGDVIVSRRDRRRRAVSQRILVSTDLDRLRRCGHRVNGIIHADDSNRLGLYDTDGKALKPVGKD